MTNSYDLSDVAQLVAFDADCVRVAKEFPMRKATAITEIPSFLYSVAGVFATWFEDRTLWCGGGWHKLLDARTRATFERYALFRDGRVYDSETGVIYDPIDTFQITTGYAKK